MKWLRRSMKSALVATAGVALGISALAQGTSDQDIAKQLVNPVASLISVALQFNWDRNIGPGREGRKFFLNVQPVIPIPINRDWLVISKWTVPINATVTKLTRIDKQPLSIGLGARYYADSPISGPHGWGARLVVTFVFPK